MRPDGARNRIDEARESVSTSRPCGAIVRPARRAWQAGSSGVRLIPEGPPTLASPRLETPAVSKNGCAAPGRRMCKRLPILLLASLLLLGCRAQDEAAATATVQVASPEEGGAVSTAPVQVEAADAPASQERSEPVPDEPEGVDWSPMELAPGEASVSCELDYAREGDGAPLLEFDRDAIADALGECAERGVVRLRYAGKINAAFASMMQRVIHVADELDIDKRVLDINSSGGMVEDAIRTGDRIAESRWTVWVREDAVCHSACVFILAAGDMRMVSGRIGIHRIIRMSSTASTRVELNRELRVVYDRVRDYLERNGAATAVADLMMAVPNRNLRLLTGDELGLYGLDGINPAQDD